MSNDSQLPLKKTPKADMGRLLHHHGTRPWQLTAANLAQAAKADIAAKSRNREIEKERLEYPSGHPMRRLIGPKLKYSFLPAHVKKAQSAAQLIEFAIEGMADATKDNSINVMRIYESREKLQEAHAILRRE